MDINLKALTIRSVAALSVGNMLEPPGNASADRCWDGTMDLMICPNNETICLCRDQKPGGATGCETGSCGGGACSWDATPCSC